jgi:hypothetical protein
MWILYISKLYGPPWPVTGIATSYLLGYSLDQERNNKADIK